MRVQFGGFTLDSSTRELFRGVEAVHLSPKAFQLLLALIEARPKAIAKADLHERLWPSTFVSETNLAGLIAELRGALQDDAREPRFIRTVYGFGYSFSGEAREQAPARERPLSVPANSNVASIPTEVLLPARVTRWAGTPMLIAAFAVLLGAGALSYFRRSAEHEKYLPVTGVRTIAVLPFRNIGAASSDDYVGLGLTDSLITKLSNVKQIRVRPTSAVRKYAGVEPDSIAAGRELKVDAVLEGNILKSGQTMRVTVQLVSLAERHPFLGRKV